MGDWALEHHHSNVIQVINRRCGVRPGLDTGQADVHPDTGAGRESAEVGVPRVPQSQFKNKTPQAQPT